MSTPLLPWDIFDDAEHPRLVWRARCDDRYLVEVHRIDAYHGTLHVFDHTKEDTEIFSSNVGLSYGALFGPDVDDLEVWQTMVANFLDNDYSKR